jgi:predicted XRE-type DNA-binding protein
MKKRLKIEKGSGNVFRDAGFPPGEAHNLLLRAEMTMRIEEFVRKSGLTQQAAARVLGVTQPRLNQLLKRKIELFSLDALVNMLTKAGMRVELRVKQAA